MLQPLFSRLGTCGRPFALTLLALALVTVSCTLVTARTDGQCFNDNECRARGPAFANTTCTASGTCALVTLPEAGADASTSTTCTTNQQCNAALSTQARCASQECQKLTNANCSVVDGDPTDPNAIFVGVMTPRTGINANYGLNQYSVISGAAAEWNAHISGTTAHQVVTIGCDEIADPLGTATFLSTTLQVASIFGPIYDFDFEQAVPAAALNGTFLLGSRVDDIKLPTLQGVGKNVWSFSPNRSVQAKYLPNVVSTLEPSIKTMFGITTGNSMKVAFAVAGGDDLSSPNFADAVEPNLVFNGKSATSQNGTYYSRISIPFSFSTANDYTSTVAALATANPDFVIVAQEYELLNLMRAINAGWTGSKFPRFLFLTEDPAVETEAQIPGEKFAGKIDFVTWTLSAQEKSNATAFAVAYKTAAGDDAAAFSAPLYDAFYENAYALQSVLLTNGNLFTIDPGAYQSAVLGFNAPGTLVSVGVGSGTPNNISQALTLIATAKDIDLDGASGPLEFDATSRSPVEGADLECIKAAGAVSESGVILDGTSGAASGTYSCL